MIEVLREMILGVTSAAIFAAVMLQFARKSALEEVVRLAAGMLMILALLTPLARLRLPHPAQNAAQSLRRVTQQTEQARRRNEELAQSSVSRAVSQYLEERAREMEVACTVHVALAADADGTMAISSVAVRGRDITAAQRRALSQCITESCGALPEQITFAEE